MALTASPRNFSIERCFRVTAKVFPLECFAVYGIFYIRAGKSSMVQGTMHGATRSRVATYIASMIEPSSYTQSYIAIASYIALAH